MIIRRVLGIDPGTATTGWAVVEEKASREKLIASGAITTPKTDDLPARLDSIYRAISDIIKKYRPKTLAIEELFFAKNVKTALAVGQACGVVLLVAKQNKLQIHEHKPTQIKQAITGYGGSGKRQIQEMIRLRLGMKEIIRPDDAADAVGIALTELQTKRY